MLIGGLQKLTLIDYPGNVACVVFLVGCNFRCGYCHNPELVLPEKIKNQLIISEAEFFNFLEKRKGLLTGVVISGGESTIYKELLDFIKKIRKFGYLIKLDTNGSNPEMLSKLIDDNLLDYVAMDVKAPLGLKSKIQNYKSQINPKSKILNSKLKVSKYEKVAGVKIDLEKIKKSIEIIKSSDIDYEFRTTVMPMLHTKKDIVQIAKEISPAKRYYLQNFKPEKTLNPKYEKYRPFSQEELKSIQKECNKYLLTQLRN